MYINTPASNYIWFGIFSTNNNTSVKCFERIFPDFNALYDFCKRLKDGAFQGLCDCVCIRFFRMDGRQTYCTLEHYSHARIRRYVSLVQNPKRDYFECLCPCRLLTGLAPLYGIVIPILLIWYGIVTCSIVHDLAFNLLSLNRTHVNSVSQSKYW